MAANLGSRTFASGAVRVEGLAELRVDLRRMGRDLPKVIRDANLTAARRVKESAEGNLVTKYGKPAPSRLSAGATQKYGYVQLRGATAFGDEFGATHYKQFRPSRGRKGYVIFPAMRRELPALEAEILNWLEASFAGRAA